MRREALAFLAMTACGGGISLLFDLLRAVRRSLKPKAVLGAVMDILFCAASCFSALWCVWHFNSGAFRFYEVTGLILGGIFYFTLLSKWALRIFSVIIENILKFVKLILKILLTPPMFLYKILLVPVYGRIKNKIQKDRTAHDKRIQGKNC